MALAPLRPCPCPVVGPAPAAPKSTGFLVDVVCALRVGNKPNAEAGPRRRV